MTAVEPGERYAAKIPNRPTTFWALHLSMRDQKRIMLAYDSWLDPKKTTDDAFRETMEMFAGVIVGWDDGYDLKTGALVRFTDEGVTGIDRILDVVDARELCRVLLRNGRPDAPEKKGSSSPP